MPDSPPTVARAPSSWRSRRWLAPLAAAAGLALLIGVILLRHGGPVAADATEHVVSKTFIGPLERGSTIDQQLTARAPGLSHVAVRFFEPLPASKCTVSAELLDQHGARVASHQVPCRDITDGALTSVVSFPPMAESEGRTYELRLGLADAGGHSVMLFAGPDDTSDLPFVRVGGVTQEVTLEVHSSYGDDATAADQLGTALGRMSENRPLWQQPAGVVITALVALGAVIALTRTRGRAAIVLLVLFVVAKGLLWTAIIPPFQSPDEPGHFAYAQFMAESHGIPIRDNTRFGDTKLTSEEVRSLGVAMHINAYAFGDRSDYGPVGREQFDALAGLSGVDEDPHGNGPAAGYTPAYYAPAAVFYSLWNARVDQRVQVVRWWSIALGVVLALAVFAIGRRLFPGSEVVAIALAVAVSAQPMVSQQSAVVNNDAMVIAGGAVCLLLALDLLRAVPDRGRRLAFWSAFALGLTILAKSFGVVLVPVVFLGWLVGRMRTQKADRPPLIREALGAAAGLAVTYGAWAIIARSIGFKNATLGDFSSDGLAHPLSGYLRLLKDDSFQFIRANLVDQLWGVFGWLRAPLPRWILTSIGWLTVVVGVIAVVWVVRVLLDAVRRVRARDWTGFDVDGTTVGAMLLGTIVGTVVLLYAIEFTIYRINGAYVLQGRYFLVMLPALLLLPVMAVPRLVPRLSATVVSTAIAAGTVALNVISVAVIVEHFYL